MARPSARVLLALAAIPVGLLVVAAFLLGLSYGGRLSADWGAASPTTRSSTGTRRGAR